ncbi:transcriptional regulator with XRE-family HTH domain [Actinoplanes campanulatus]|uniref:Transcriptional regulator with XRE-family HTH domain n=1 Tax=Actinoplanes campanulatus TaxID=113559 RepID=A0A7W5AI97_9ACTN|nr:transcriptional regulator with XRE-family HTH domain [Actinoplanes campanulatus]GGN30040.1 putative transcriptional regulatory protein [Actinoplanes campanulatus]GID37129.1 putative transcriptional regulatory protein [Actinoplanes campanulatus]
MPLLRRVIGAVLRRIRLGQGRTLREVAGAAGVSLPYLSEVERGTKEASSEVLAAICRALGLPMPDLLDEVRREMLREAAPASQMVTRLAVNRGGGGPRCSVGRWMRCASVAQPVRL